MPEVAKWTDIGQLVVGVCGLLVSVGGLLLIVYQLREVQHSIQAQTTSDLYDHYHQMISVFVKRPDMRPYFYEKKALEPSASPALRADVESMCELIAGVLEHALFQGNDVGEKRWKECWDPYIKERFLKSSILQQYLKNNAEWYSSKLQEKNPLQGQIES